MRSRLYILRVSNQNLSIQLFQYHELTVSIWSHSASFPQLSETTGAKVEFDVRQVEEVTVKIVKESAKGDFYLCLSLFGKFNYLVLMSCTHIMSHFYSPYRKGLKFFQCLFGML